MTSTLTLFLEQKLWIDLLCIIVLTSMCYLHILRASNKQQQINKEYNTSLLELRTQIYVEYERDFFL